MIVDTSALVAIFADEPERSIFTALLMNSASTAISGGSWIEFGTVLVRRFGQSRPVEVLDRLIGTLQLSVEPVTPEQIDLAMKAYAIYGHGAKHKAALNFGDCFAYALAKARAEPLLFKGNDFSETDVTAVIWA